jgi:hypothetical protein
MLTNALPTNATSSFGMSPWPLPQAFVPVAPDQGAPSTHDAHADRDQLANRIIVPRADG